MALTSATSRKTLQLDILQLGKLNFLTTSNTPIPSSFILSANGNGTTSFVPISTLITDFYPPGQAYVASTVQSTMYNILTYPNVVSSIAYNGNSGLTTMSTLANSLVLPNNGNALFSSFQYNFSSITKYINPNGSSKMFIDYYPNFTFSPVMEPSSISSVTLYPEGNSSIKNLISLSSHLIYTSANSNVPVIKSGIQQYIPITSAYPYGVSSFINPRILSNTYVTPMRFEVDTNVVSSNLNFGFVHYISDGIGSLKTTNGYDVFRSGFDRTTLNINNNVGDKNSVFVTITNSGNQF